MFSLLIVISVYDMRHKIIPDKLVYIYAVIALFSIFVNQTGMGSFFITPPLMSVLSGPLFALPFALLWLVSRGRWMGLGDAKLTLGLGWMLGPLATLAMITLSFWIGAVVGLALMFFSRRKIGMKTEIPFAPFLIISTFIIFIFSVDIFSLTALFHL